MGRFSEKTVQLYLTYGMDQKADDFEQHMLMLGLDLYTKASECCVKLASYDHPEREKSRLRLVLAGHPDNLDFFLDQLGSRSLDLRGTTKLDKYELTEPAHYTGREIDWDYRQMATLAIASGMWAMSLGQAADAARKLDKTLEDGLRKMDEVDGTTKMV